MLTIPFVFTHLHMVHTFIVQFNSEMNQGTCDPKHDLTMAHYIHNILWKSITN